MLNRYLPLVGALTLFAWVLWLRTVAFDRSDGTPAGLFRTAELAIAIVATVILAVFAVAAGVAAAVG